MGARQGARPRKQPGQLQLRTADGVRRSVSEQGCGETRGPTAAVREDFSGFAVRAAGDGRRGKFLSAGAEYGKNDGSGERNFGKGSEQYGNAFAGFGLLRREGRTTR